MNLQINQKNLYLLLPSKISRIAEILREDQTLTPAQAMKIIYASPLYKSLEDEQSKLWCWGPVDLYKCMTTK